MTKLTETASQKHGYWYTIGSGGFWDVTRCSICKERLPFTSRYDDDGLVWEEEIDTPDTCPSCGAIMDELYPNYVPSQTRPRQIRGIKWRFKVK